MCRCGVTFRDSLPQTAGGWTDVALMRTPFPYSNALLTFPLFPQWDSALVWHGAERTHGAPLRHCCCQERGEIKGERSPPPDVSAWWMRQWNAACFSNLGFRWEDPWVPSSDSCLCSGSGINWRWYTFPHSTERCGRTRTPAATPPNPKKALNSSHQAHLTQILFTSWSFSFCLLNASVGLRRKYVWKSN